MSIYEEVLHIVNTLDKIKLNVEDGDRWAILEGVVPGKVKALRGYLEQLNMAPLVREIDSINFEEFNLIELLTRLRNYVIPETRRQIAQEAMKDSNTSENFFREHIHPEIKSVSQGLFQNGHYAEAAEAAFKKINADVKRTVQEATGEELDGARLMNRALSLDRPIIRLADLSSQSGTDIQKGYMQIFAGAMTGIRNPKAHDNITIDTKRAVHLLYLASLLMFKLDESSSPPKE